MTVQRMQSQLAYSVTEASNRHFGGRQALDRALAALGIDLNVECSGISPLRERVAE